MEKEEVREKEAGERRDVGEQECHHQRDRDAHHSAAAGAEENGAE